MEVGVLGGCAVGGGGHLGGGSVVSGLEEDAGPEREMKLCNEFRQKK